MELRFILLPVALVLNESLPQKVLPGPNAARTRMLRGAWVSECSCLRRPRLNTCPVARCSWGSSTLRSQAPQGGRQAGMQVGEFGSVFLTWLVLNVCKALGRPQRENLFQ